MRARRSPELRRQRRGVCSASGSIERTECDAYSECVDQGGARCEAADLPLGMEVNEFGFSWRDAYMLLPCYEEQAHDCLTVPSGDACPNSGASFEELGLILKETFEIGGELGKLYRAHLVINGIVSGKYYQGGTRDNGMDFSNLGDPAGSDGFYRGGSAIPSSYDVYQITVRDSAGTEQGRYYLNSFPQASGLESHQTVALGYEKDIEVPGGGTIEYRIHDSNCRAINNCGLDLGCGAPRHVPNEPGLVLPENWLGRPLTSWNSVNGAQQPFHAQIIHLRVTKITFVKEL